MVSCPNFKLQASKVRDCSTNNKSKTGLVQTANFLILVLDVDLVLDCFFFFLLLPATVDLYFIRHCMLYSMFLNSWLIAISFIRISFRSSFFFSSSPPRLRGPDVAASRLISSLPGTNETQASHLRNEMKKRNGGDSNRRPHPRSKNLKP